MRAQLIQYVDLLFAGAKDCEDIHQEILQNTLDRYDDLILEGKTPEAAYRLAILGIGDVGEILGTQTVSTSTIRTTAEKKAAAPAKKNWVPVVVAAVIAVLVFIIGILVLNFAVVKRSADRYPVESQVALLIEKAEGKTFRAEKAISIHSKPTDSAEVKGKIEAGSEIYITRDELINDQHWGYVTEPEQGWIPLGGYLEEIEGTAPTLAAQDNTSAIVTTPAEAYPDINGYGANAQDVQEISIEWVAGSIQIIPVQGNRIEVEESGHFGENTMELKRKNGKLSIEFSRPGLHLGKDLSKDLLIKVPADWVLNELDISAAAATVSVEGLTVRKVEFEGASGMAEFANCHVDSLDVDTASGDVHFTGSLKKLECDAASASFTGILTNVPSQIEMESMSGGLDLILPEDAGFTVITEGVDCNVTSDFPITCSGTHHGGHHDNCDAKTHTHGDGACRIEMSALSGDVRIRKDVS